MASASILITDPIGEQVKSPTWDVFYKQSPFITKGIEYINTAGLFTSVPGTRVNPKPDVLLAWRPDDQSPISVYYPALLGHLAVQLPIFRLFQEDIIERKLDHPTAIWDNRSLPIYIFTGAEFDPEWLPLIIRYSITGELPTSDATTVLIGRAIGDGQLQQYGSDNLKAFLDDTSKDIIGWVGLRRYPWALQNRPIVDAKDLPLYKRNIKFFTEFAVLLANFSLFEPELRSLDDAIAVADYIQHTEATQPEVKREAGPLPQRLTGLSYCHLIAYLRRAVQLVPTTVALLDDYIKKVTKLQPKETYTEYAERVRRAHETYTKAQVQVAEQLKVQLTQAAALLDGALNALVMYLRSQPGGDRYTGDNMAQCAAFDTFSDIRTSREERKYQDLLLNVRNLYNTPRIIPTKGGVTPMLPLTPEQPSSILPLI